jgi:hypothetical protein
VSLLGLVVLTVIYLPKAVLAAQKQATPAKTGAGAKESFDGKRISSFLVVVSLTGTVLSIFYLFCMQRWK